MAQRTGEVANESGSPAKTLAPRPLRQRDQRRLFGTRRGWSWPLSLGSKLAAAASCSIRPRLALAMAPATSGLMPTAGQPGLGGKQRGAMAIAGLAARSVRCGGYWPRPPRRGPGKQGIHHRLAAAPPRRLSGKGKRQIAGARPRLRIRLWIYWKAGSSRMLPFAKALSVIWAEAGNAPACRHHPVHHVGAGVEMIVAPGGRGEGKHRVDLRPLAEVGGKGGFLVVASLLAAG